MKHCNKSAGRERTKQFSAMIIGNQWDWGQIGTKFGTKHVIYQKLAYFM